MIELQFTPDGKVRSIYKDERQSLFREFGDLKVKRASNVEWEKTFHGSGWTVRAAHDPELAIRIFYNTGRACYEQVVSRTYGLIATFPTREAALDAELAFFWALLPPNQEHE
jgi:superoxide dismutase